MNKIVLEAVLIRQAGSVQSRITLEAETIGNMTLRDFIQFVKSQFPGWKVERRRLAEV